MTLQQATIDRAVALVCLAVATGFVAASASGNLPWFAGVATALPCAGFALLAWLTRRPFPKYDSDTELEGEPPYGPTAQPKHSEG